MMNDDLCYAALRARDARMDGVFFTGVVTTGVYCRPSCPAITPRRENVRFFATAAAAQEAGLRACKRCRPDAVPGSPAWNVRADTTARAMRMIADGVVEREGVSGLAARLGYGERQIHRVLTAELGAGPLALARARRAQLARTLIETTDLPVTQVAYAAGFASLRQFHDTVRAVFAATPTQMRERTRRGRRSEGTPSPGAIDLRLAYRAPLELADLWRFLGDRAVPGVESLADGVYRRVLALPHGHGVVALSAPPRAARRPAEGAHYVACRLELDDVRDLGAAVERCRRLLDLDADPVAVAAHLGGDPLLAPSVARAPGRRVPGAVDGAEMAVRAILGQQVSVAAARTLAGRLAQRYGAPLVVPREGLAQAFPTAGTLAGADPATLGIPLARGRALVGLMAALATGRVCLDAGVDRDEAAAALGALPGVGPWTVAYLRMRALRDPDAFLPTDLGVRRALEALGEPADPTSAARRAERWRPWRAYALMHLWAAPAGPARPDASRSAESEQEAMA